MTNSLKTLLTLIFLALAFPAQAKEPLVHIRLIPERTTVKPGDEIWIAIEQTIKLGWHTYWKNPGDSGTAPRIKWTTPYAFRVGDIEWPVPQKINIGSLTNYGYEDKVTLLQKLKVPKDDLQNGPLHFTVKTEILVCKEECIPEYGTYELTLNDPHDTADNSAFIKTARAATPAQNIEANFHEDKDFLVLEIPVTWSQKVAKYDFIPEDWGVVSNSAKPEITEKNGTLTIKQKRGDRPLTTLKEIKGLLLWNKNAYALTAHKEIAANPAQTAPMPKLALLNVLFLALLGGLTLNLMPCVFPVLSIKALSLVKISKKNPEIARLHGIAYTAGIVLSFLFIAGLLIAFRAGGAEIGWGFQLQNPIVVTLLAWLLFVIGLNLSGLFEVSGALGNVGNKLTQGEGVKNSFFTGILATLVATPCTAPFMAAAIGAALLQPPPIALLIFASLGFGLALPYLALSFAPALQKALPKPGKWMEVFKQILAFPMYASSAWLVWVLSQQAGSMGTFGALMGLVLIAFSIQLLRYKRRVFAAITLAAALFLLPVGQMTMPPQSPAEMEMKSGFGEPWSPEKLETLLRGGKPVFVEMTAAWCITCKVNHAVALNIDSTKKVFANNNVQYLIGDWTRQDARITEYLNSFGRNGVPIYVFYGPPQNGQRPAPVLLPQLLTPGIVAGAIEEK